MSIGAVLIATIVAQSTPHVIGSQGYEMDRDQATIAELIERPRGLTNEEFAEKLIDASGLRPWNGKHMSFPAAPGRMGGKAITSRSGPEVTVYFVPSDVRTVGRVCRISRKRGGMTDAFVKAQDWCASSLGLPTPLKRESPVRTVKERIQA
jgi:hypothetical protein